MKMPQYRPTLLDVPISVFSTAKTIYPKSTITLRRAATSQYYQHPVESIRTEMDEEKQKELKKTLPAFTPAALLHHRKTNTSHAEKIKHQWPVLMGDVDRKDNPGVNMAELKECIARLPYVLICAYSVRKGLWFALRLPDNQTPETLAAHFRYVQELFSKKFGITLDSTKGDKPTDLRFVSYDDQPYINELPTVMDKTYTPPKPCLPNLPPLIINDRQQSGEWELKQVVEQARKAQKGDRHYPLLKAATLAGGFIGAGRLDHDTAVYALETIASELDDFRDSVRAIKDGIRYGEQRPLSAEDKIPPRQNAPAPRPVVTTVAGQLARPGSILRPDESQIERWAIIETPDHYPALWDVSNPPGAVPTIKVLSLNQYLNKTASSYTTDDFANPHPGR